MKMKKTKTRATAPKISEAAAVWYDAATAFDSLNAGATFVLDVFPALYSQALREMRGKFIQGELSMLLDVQNGTIITIPGAAGRALLLNVADSFDLYPGVYEEKWGVDGPALNEKLKTCTSFQLLVLEIWCGMFWGGEYDTPDAITKHCRPLL
jgi:hypothetical protein